MEDELGFQRIEFEVSVESVGPRCRLWECGSGIQYRTLGLPGTSNHSNKWHSLAWPDDYLEMRENWSWDQSEKPTP